MKCNVADHGLLEQRSYCMHRFSRAGMLVWLARCNKLCCPTRVDTTQCVPASDQKIAPRLLLKFACDRVTMQLLGLVQGNNIYIVAIELSRFVLVRCFGDM